jgi:hypothetical protein
VVRPLGGDAIELALEHVAPRAEEPDRHRALADPAEEEGDRERIGHLPRHRDRLLAQDPELAASLDGDPIDGARWATSLGFGAHRLDEPFGFEVAQLAIEGPDAHPTPRRHVRLLRIPPDAVSMAWALSIECAEDEKPR